MKRILLIAALSVAAAFPQSFPGSIYTPLVAKDNVSTTLSQAMLVSDTTAFVASTTGWAANTLVYICDSSTSTAKCTGTYEIMKVTSVGGANALNVTRAQAGTSALAHAVGKTLSNAPVSLYNKSVNDEVLAIETALGANLSNIPGAGGGVVPVANGGTGVTAAQGNGSKVQLSTGAPTTNNCAKFDANGNTVDAGLPCNSLTLPAATGQLQYFRIKQAVANLTTTEFAAKPILDTPDYNFTPIQPGGSLIAGSNAITLAVCPLGVSGTNTNYKLYISGGIGVAEAVAVTGGTCVGTTGTTGGTVIVTTANTHTGAWTIGSATAGCSEAFWSNGGGGNIAIQFPAGSITTYAPCYISASNTSVMGRGIGTTTITNTTLNSNAFTFNGGSSQLNLSGMLLIGNASSTTGSCAEFDNLGYVAIRDVYCLTWPTGFNLNGLVTSSLSNSYVRDIHGGDGVLVQGNSTNALIIDGVIVISGFAYQSGLHVAASGNLVVANSQFIGNFGGVTKADIWIAPSAGNVFSTDIINTYADQGVRGLWINPTTGNQVIRTRATHFWASSTTGTGIGVHLDNSGGGQIHGFSCVNCDISGSANNGLQVDNGDSIAISDSTLSNNGGTGVVLNAGQWITLTGNKIGNGFNGWGGGPTQQYGVYAFPGVATNVAITGNMFDANAIQPVLLPATSTKFVIANNEGIDDLALATLASSTTVALTTPNPAYYITGTTTTTTISGSNWRGRILKLIKTDAGSVTIGGGGNIPGTHTLAQNGSLTLQFDGTSWF